MDKVDTYDKEQLQAMGWLFDETETPDTAVRFVEQNLTSEQQMQVFKSLGWGVYVTDSKSFLGSTLTPEEIERFKVMSAIILTDLNKIFLYGGQSGDYIRFYGMVNNTQFGGIDINPSTGYVSGVGAYRFLDLDSVHFTKQTLTTAQQNTALSNIGSGLFVLDIENGQATLTDEQEARLLSSNGVILRGTVNASNEVLTKIYFSDYQGGDVVAFYAVRSYVSCLRCTYTKSTKIFRFIGGVGWSNPTYVSTGSPQNFSASEQAQALANIGLDYVIITMGGGSATLTEEQETALLASKGVILTGTASGQYWKNRVFVRDPDLNTFYSVLNNTMMVYCNYNSNTKVFKYQGVIKYTDTNAVSFNTKQHLTTGQQVQARTNIGVQSADELLADDNFIAQLKTKLGL